MVKLEAISVLLYVLVICAILDSGLPFPLIELRTKVPYERYCSLSFSGLTEMLICRWTPYGNTKCMICKQQVHQDAKYCHTCAYTKGADRANFSFCVYWVYLLLSNLVIY